jgi:hypothetical protein
MQAKMISLPKSGFFCFEKLPNLFEKNTFLKQM